MGARAEAGYYLAIRGALGPRPQGETRPRTGHAGAGACVIDDEKIIEGSDTFLAQGVGDTAQGVGVAQGVGDRSAQGDDDHNDAVFSVTYSADSEIAEASDTNAADTTASGSHSDEWLSVHSRVDSRPRAGASLAARAMCPWF